MRGRQVKGYYIVSTVLGKLFYHIIHNGVVIILYTRMDRVFHFFFHQDFAVQLFKFLIIEHYMIYNNIYMQTCER